MTSALPSGTTAPAPQTTAILNRYLTKKTAQVVAQAEALITGKSISVHSYKDIPFAAHSLWLSGDHNNRTWQFSLHSFAPLDCLLINDNTDHAIKLTQDWIDLHGISPSTKLGQFPWHDHATALRLDRVSLLELRTQTGQFSQMARSHAELLMRTDFYSKHTNHGYDQALALILAAFTFSPYLDTSRWMRTGLIRLADEIDFAFNAEGVHVENSPSYHVGMVSNLVRGRCLLSQIKHDITIPFDDILDRALLFTAWAIGPNRKVAMMGDSTDRGGAPPPELSNLPNYQNALYACTGGSTGTPPASNFAVYSDAGYGFYRSTWAQDTWKSHVYLAMKSGFLSKYHRQDDDLNILLKGFGEKWLVDSGLYNHNQQDPRRQYMRSALAHNVPFVTNRPISRVLPTGPSRPTLAATTNTDGTVRGFDAKTRMYKGMTVRRRVEVQSEELFQIMDSFTATPAGSLKYGLFHVPADKTIRVSPHFARITGRTMELTIRIGTGTVKDCKVYRGFHKQFPSMTSDAINQIEDTQVIVFGPIESDSVRYSLKFTPVSV